MATYQIEWKASALRELKRIDKQVVPRIVTAVESLADNAFPAGVRKLQGTEHTYRTHVTPPEQRICLSAMSRLQ